MSATRVIDEEKLGAFVGQVVTECAAALSVPLVVIGDRLGFYRALAESGPLSSSELAQHTGTKERYVRDWLVNQAAGGYLDYDPTTRRYVLPPEHAIALTGREQPVLPGRGLSSHSAVDYGPRSYRRAIPHGGGHGLGRARP